MHLGKTLPHLQRTVLLQIAMRNLTLSDAENAFAPQRCAATLIVTIYSNPDR